MDHESLRTASTYLNNLLLARGLLRNAEPIDFVKPSRESRAQIINLVHDLILREDRDKEQQENFAFTIRQLRAEDARKVHEIERLNAKSVESDRAAAQAQAAERTAQTELKKVEKAMKTLQDQTTKLKTTLAQVKSQCINDVRKRDLELQRLKTHLQGQQRGSRVAMTGPSMTVRKTITEAPSHDIGDPEYSLKQETTEFLTKLSQNLSDENDSLISVIRTALLTLRELLGLPANSARHPDSAVGSMGSNAEPRTKPNHGSEMLHALPTSYETLSADMESTLGHLKSILTNPNFVSMEEVELREEEISRLREGWVHMEKRWKDVMYLLQDWLRRMNTGETINVDDLRRGIGLVSPDRDRDAIRPGAIDQSLVESDASEIRLPGIEEEASSAILSSLRKPEPGSSSPKRKRDVLEPPEFFTLRPSHSSSEQTPGSPPKHVRQRDSGYPSTSRGSARVLQDNDDHDDDDESEELEVPRMTIEEKLSAAQEEAELAAAGRVTRQEAGSSSQTAKVPAYDLNASLDGLVHERDDDTLGKMQSPMGKRTKIRGRPRKRKSTLLPEELETLICADE